MSTSSAEQVAVAVGTTAVGAIIGASVSEPDHKGAGATIGGIVGLVTGGLVVAILLSTAAAAVQTVEGK
jgi:hypothetical protein